MSKHRVEYIPMDWDPEIQSSNLTDKVNELVDVLNDILEVLPDKEEGTK